MFIGINLGLNGRRGNEVTPNVYVSALISAGWTGSDTDISQLNTLSESLMGVATLNAARTANTLLVAPCLGSTVSARKMCLFHPTGVGTVMTTSLADAQITNTGIKGDGATHVDTLYDGLGLGWQDFTAIIHGRFFQSVARDTTQYLLYGAATRLNGATHIMHQTSTSFYRSGSTFSFPNGGYCQGPAIQSGTIGSVCLGTASDKQRQWQDAELVSQTTEAGAYGNLGSGTATFKLLATDTNTNGSSAEIQTLVICPGLSNAEYPIVQDAVSAMNAHRATHPVATVTTPKKLWIFAGQSNITGVQTVSASQNYSGDVLDEAHPNLKQWKRIAGVAAPLRHPVDFDPASSGPNVGPAIAFGVAMLAANPTQQIIIVPAGVGATGFSSNNWNPGDAVYEAMLSMTNAAIAAGGEVAGLVWNQGEGDTTLTNRQLADAFETMLADFKSRITGGWPLGASVVLGQIANPAAFRDSAMNLIVAEVPDTVYVTQAMAGADLLTDAVRFDDLSKIHYSAVSQRLMGTAYATAVIA